jgi:hypothetical protein
MTVDERLRVVAAAGSVFRDKLTELLEAVDASELPTDMTVRKAALAAAEQLLQSGVNMIETGRAILNRESRNTLN